MDKDCWQSSWQNLLEENTQLIDLTEGDTMVTKGDTMVTKGDNVTKAARAQSAVTSRTVISTRVRPATARIRY